MAEDQREKIYHIWITLHKIKQSSLIETKKIYEHTETTSDSIVVNKIETGQDTVLFVDNDCM